MFNFPIPKKFSNGSPVPEGTRVGLVWPEVSNPLLVEGWVKARKEGREIFSEWKVVGFDAVANMETICLLTNRDQKIDLVRDLLLRPGDPVYCIPTGEVSKSGKPHYEIRPYFWSTCGKIERPFYELTPQERPGEFGTPLPTWYGRDPFTMLNYITAPIMEGSRCVINAQAESGKTTTVTFMARSMYLARKAGMLNRTTLIGALGIGERAEEHKSVGGKEWYDFRFHIPLTVPEADQLLYMVMARMCILRLSESNVHVFLTIDSLTRLMMLMNEQIPKFAPSAAGAGSGGVGGSAKDWFKRWIGMLGLPEDPQLGPITSVSTVLEDANDKAQMIVIEIVKALANNSMNLLYALGVKDLWPAMGLFQEQDDRNWKKRAFKAQQRESEHKMAQVLGVEPKDYQLVKGAFVRWVGGNPENAHQRLMALCRGMNEKDFTPFDLYKELGVKDFPGNRVVAARLHALCITKDGDLEEFAKEELQKGANEFMNLLLGSGDADLVEIAVMIACGKLRDQKVPMDLILGHLVEKVLLPIAKKEKGGAKKLQELLQGRFADDLNQMITDQEQGKGFDKKKSAPSRRKATGRKKARV